MAKMLKTCGNRTPEDKAIEIKLSNTQHIFEKPELYDDHQFATIPANESISDHYNQVIEWCNENNVTARFVGTWLIADNINQYSLWIIEDSHQMTLFKLRWS